MRPASELLKIRVEMQAVQQKQQYHDDDTLDAEVLTLHPRDEAAAAPTCDLQAPGWSVICFDGIEAGGLTYQQAIKLMAELDSHRIAGLCIVTDEAAKRIG